MANETQLSSTLGTVLTAGELALSLLRRVNQGEISPQDALNQAESQWNEAASEAAALRSLGHE